jgi:hypothetical protein
MAKLAAPEDGGPPNGGPDSATNQWFFSLADNSQNLDNQNGGFTVFGRVVGAGMTVVDQIAALPRVNAGSPYDNLPVRDFVGGTIFKENLVIFSSITMLDLPDGDYNFDGVVDGADLLIWQADIGSTTRAEADGNGDGVINQADLVVWRNNYGATAVAAISAVPEPATAAIAFVGAGLLALARRRLRYG